MSFDGFPKEGLDFLTTLGTKDKAWFDTNRAAYDTHVVPHAKSFVTAMGDALADRLSPAIEAQPKTNGSIAPINNDLRFNPDASPYKDHLMFRFWEGPQKKTAAMLMVRMSPADGVGFATGAAIPDLDRWRSLVDDDRTGSALADAIHEVVHATGAEVVGEGLKNVPKPFDAEHPRADLLRHKGLQVRWLEPTPKSITKASFVDWCVDRLAQTEPVHRWLVQHLI